MNVPVTNLGVSEICTSQAWRKFTFAFPENDLLFTTGEEWQFMIDFGRAERDAEDPWVNGQAVCQFNDPQGMGTSTKICQPWSWERFDAKTRDKSRVR
jgi:hypothetical protein